MDGIEVRNQFEGSTQGLGLEISPTALEEVEVITGELRRGVRLRAVRRGEFRDATGQPGAVDRPRIADDGPLGAGLAVPRVQRHLHVGRRAIRPLGATLFTDLLVQSFVDAEPRTRGLTCLRPDDAGPELAQAIDALRGDPSTAHLYCPYTSGALPAQSGDKLIGFARFDRPLGDGAEITVSLLRNRFQRELYTPEFKYNADYQLGQRTTGTLASVGLQWTRHMGRRALHVTARGAFVRLDRYLGALDVRALRERGRIGGVSLADFEFLGEDFTRSPIEEQLAAGIAVPGYRAPGGSVGSPFGPAAEGILFTKGTPDIAAWSRSDFFGADVVGELNTASGHALRAGGSAKLFRVENYSAYLRTCPARCRTTRASTPAR